MGFNLIELVESCISQHNASNDMSEYYTVKIGDTVKTDNGVEYVLNYHSNDTIEHWRIGEVIFRHDGLIDVYKHPWDAIYLFPDYKPILVFNPFEDDPNKLVEAIGELIKILRGSVSGLESLGEGR